MSVEDVEAFRQRARGWIREHLRSVGPQSLSLRNERDIPVQVWAFARNPSDDGQPDGDTGSQ